VYRYRLYNRVLESAYPLRSATALGSTAAAPDVVLLRGRAEDFRLPGPPICARAIGGAQRRAAWFRHVPLPDGRDYLHWDRGFEFLVDGDGRRIVGRPLAGASPDMLDGLLLGHALSFALIKQGDEPLHATVVAFGDTAVGILGDCGYGKSTLAAACLAAGHRLLTDDLLVVRVTPRGVLAYPGPARLKLSPPVARRLLGAQANGCRLNPLTKKLAVPLRPDQHAAGPLRLAALVVLRVPRPSSRAVVLRRLAARASWEELTRNTFNLVVKHPDRLQRQFESASALAQRVPVYSLSYPMGWPRLPAAVRALARAAQP